MRKLQRSIKCLKKHGYTILYNIYGYTEIKAQTLVFWFNKPQINPLLTKTNTGHCFACRKSCTKPYLLLNRKFCLIDRIIV